MTEPHALIERLRERRREFVHYEAGRGFCAADERTVELMVHVNPDGDEAADLIEALLALTPAGTGEPALDDEGYLWKWVERGLFDRQISAAEALSVIAHHPAAPWNNGRWEVDHKPYANNFYAEFPKAKGSKP